MKWLIEMTWKRACAVGGPIVVGVGVAAGAIWAAGVDRTNLGRDVRANTVEISQAREDINANASKIDANHDEFHSEVRDQRSALSRIEECVEWIKSDLQKADR